MARRAARVAMTVGLALLLLAAPLAVIPAAIAEPAPPALIERSYEVLEVYLSAEQALGLIFPEAQVTTETVTLTDAQAAAVGELCGHPVAERRMSVHRATRDGRPEGYAVVADELGKFHDITFMVGITPQGRVKRVEVLVYRESRGGEIRFRRFLRQFDGKSLRDPIRPNRDVINITGATLSVRAVSRGVRKALGIVREAYGL